MLKLNIDRSAGAQWLIDYLYVIIFHHIKEIIKFNG